MGNVADDMIEGLSCSHCGTYFSEAHGHPVLCPYCFKKDKGKSGLPKATEKDLGEDDEEGGK